MGKVMDWIKAVIAGSQPYSAMAGIDVKKSAKRIFEEDDSGKKENGNEGE